MNSVSSVSPERVVNVSSNAQKQQVTQDFLSVVVENMTENIEGISETQTEKKDTEIDIGDALILGSMLCSSENFVNVSQNIEISPEVAELISDVSVSAEVQNINPVDSSERDRAVIDNSNEKIITENAPNETVENMNFFDVAEKAMKDSEEVGIVPSKENDTEINTQSEPNSETEVQPVKNNEIQTEQNLSVQTNQSTEIQSEQIISENVEVKSEQTVKPNVQHDAGKNGVNQNVDSVIQPEVLSEQLVQKNENISTVQNTGNAENQKFIVPDNSTSQNIGEAVVQENGESVLKDSPVNESVTTTPDNVDLPKIKVVNVPKHDDGSKNTESNEGNSQNTGNPFMQEQQIRSDFYKGVNEVKKFMAQAKPEKTEKSDNQNVENQVVELDIAGMQRDFNNTIKSVTMEQEVYKPSEIIKQTADGIFHQINGDGEKFVVKLNPEGLGEITVTILKNDTSSVLSLSVSNSKTAEILGSDLASLQESLKNLDIDFTEINIETQNQQEEQLNDYEEQYKKYQNKNNKHSNDVETEDEETED